MDYEYRIVEKDWEVPHYAYAVQRRRKEGWILQLLAWFCIEPPQWMLESHHRGLPEARKAYERCVRGENDGVPIS